MLRGRRGPQKGNTYRLVIHVDVGGANGGRVVSGSKYDGENFSFIRGSAGPSN